MGGSYKGDPEALSVPLFDVRPLHSSTTTNARTGAPLSKRTIAAKQLEAKRVLFMAQTHGRGPQDATCRGCVHLVRVGHRGWMKCEIYGITGSEASDWRAKWPACGLFTAPAVRT
jgi:hypothetical protein